jgi:hypothetical protein
LAGNLLVVEFLAARVFAVASEKQPELKVQAREHLTAAVRLGLPRDAMRNEQLQSCRNEDWFAELEKQCSSDEASVKSSRTDATDTIMRSPDERGDVLADADFLALLRSVSTG